MAESLSPNGAKTLITCTYEWMDCSGNTFTGTVTEGETIFVCASGTPQPIGCALDIVYLGDCNTQACLTTTTTCDCLSADVVISLIDLSDATNNTGYSNNVIYFEYTACDTNQTESTVFEETGTFINAFCYKIGTQVSGFYYKDDMQMQLDSSTYTDAGCCVTTTSTTCRCVSISAVDISQVSLSLSEENPQTVYLSYNDCNTQAPNTYPFTSAGLQNISQLGICADITSIEFYYLTGIGAPPTIDTLSSYRDNGCCSCTSLLMTNTSAGTICTEYVSDPNIQNPTAWFTGVISNDGLVDVTTGSLNATLVCPASGLINIVNFQNGPQLFGNELCDTTYTLNWEFTVNPNIYDNNGNIVIYFDSSPGIDIYSTTNIIVRYAGGTYTAGQTYTGSTTVTIPAGLAAYVFLRYVRYPVPGTNSDCITEDGLNINIISYFRVYNCYNIQFIDCDNCANRVEVTTGNPQTYCVLDDGIILNNGLDIVEQSGCTTPIQPTVTTTTTCDCLTITGITISQSDLQDADNGFVYLEYISCNSDVESILSFDTSGQTQLNIGVCKYNIYEVIYYKYVGGVVTYMMPPPIDYGDACCPTQP